MSGPPVSLGCAVIVSPGMAGTRKRKSCSSWIVPGPGRRVPRTAATMAAVQLPWAALWPRAAPAKMGSRLAGLTSPESAATIEMSLIPTVRVSEA